MDVGLSELWELVMDREAWRAATHAQRDGHDWATELNWTELMGGGNWLESGKKNFQSQYYWINDSYFGYDNSIVFKETNL